MNWQKQDDKALFEDLIWSRPQNKRYAGKLLIIGGQAGEFINVSSAYRFAYDAGAGSVRVLMPDSLTKIAGNIDGAEFAPSNKSGGFARSALAHFFELGEWADHVFLAGDLGKNSETTVILDGFLLKRPRPVTLSLNSLGSIGIDLAQLVQMDLTLVGDRNFLQKIGKALDMQTAITSLTTYENMGGMVQTISDLSRANLVIKDDEHIWTAVKGKVISTKTKSVDSSELSAASAVWLAQNPTKPLQALATASFVLGHPSETG